ncbi:MAG TPA: hypothetical protein V6C91_05150, partial [Coleofasciculaceae cyanobacterium]
MNRFIGLIITVVAIAALAGAAIGWRFPFLGQSRSANEVGTAQGSRRIQPATQAQAPRTAQPANRTRTQQTNQPTAQNLNNEQTTAQSPDTTANPGATTTQQEQADT